VRGEYEIILQPEPEGGFSVFGPELPSLATQGDTIEEATEMAKEAIEAYLEVMHDDGLPVPDRPPQQRRRPRGVSPSFRRSAASKSSPSSKRRAGRSSGSAAAITSCGNQLLPQWRSAWFVPFSAGPRA
jgi:antitoxin HicB